MIYTFIADISRLDTEAALELQTGKSSSQTNLEKSKEVVVPDGSFPAPRLRKEIVSHILSVSNEELKKERLGAYILLSIAVEKMFLGMPEVLRTPNGKPYFDSSFGIWFSISHAKNAVAVSLSCDSPVGVDIEGEIDKERAEKLERRFFSELSFTEGHADVSYIFAEIGKNGDCIFYPLTHVDNCYCAQKNKEINVKSIIYNECFTAKWTLYEATLKCDGGGFISLPCLGMLLLETKADTVRISLNNETFFISTAKS